MTGLEASGALLAVGIMFFFFGIMAKIESDFWGKVFFGLGGLCVLPLFLRLWMYVFIG